MTTNDFKHFFLASGKTFDRKRSSWFCPVLAAEFNVTMMSWKQIQTSTIQQLSEQSANVLLPGGGFCWCVVSVNGKGNESGLLGRDRKKTER